MNWQLGLGRQNGLAFWGLLFIEGSFGAFFPIWPIYIEELGAPIAIVGSLLALSGIFRLFVLLPTARIAAAIGSRRLLLSSRVISAIGIGSAAIAPSWPWLVPVMMGSAVGSMAFPLILAHISANAREGDRVRAFSIIVTIGPSIALLIAPLISSALIEIFSLRAPFLLSAVFSLISVAILSRISESDEEVEEELPDGQPARGYRAVLRNIPVRNLLLLKLFTIFALSLGTQLIPNYLRDVGNYTDARISLFSAFSAIGTIGFGTLVVRNRRFSDTPLLGAALAVLLVSVGYILFLTPEVMALVIIAFLFRGGMFASISLFSAVLGELASPRDREHIFTLSELVIVAGFSTAPLVAGVLYGFEPSLPLIVSAVAGVPVIALLLRLSFARRRDDGDPPSTGEVVLAADLDSQSVPVHSNAGSYSDDPP
ncbi:MAG: MFS transporter [Thermomicrobiales bacterium]